MRSSAERQDAGSSTNTAQKIGNENIVARTNAAYGIRDRVYVTNVDKGKDLDRQQLEQIRCAYTVISLRLQDGFGLRREASIDLPARADKGDTLVLQPSWNKGGREIRIRIRTAEQRQLLEEGKALAKGKSLVAPAMPPTAYLKQLRVRAGRHS